MRVTIQSLHSMRLEACPEWVSIALQRLPDSPDEEVSLDELERLAVGLRVEGCESLWSWPFGALSDSRLMQGSTDERSCGCESSRRGLWQFASSSSSTVRPNRRPTAATADHSSSLAEAASDFAIEDYLDLSSL